MSDIGKKHGVGKTALSVMVCGKGEELLFEFSSVLFDTEWLQGLLGRDDGISADVLLCTVVTLVLANHGCFQVRVVETLNAFPHKLLRLCPDEEPELRLRTGNELLNADLRDLDATTRKFVGFHRGELSALVAADGEEDHSETEWMCASVLALRKDAEADSQDIESANKLVTREHSLSPGEKEILVAARLTNRKSVCMGAAAQPKELLKNICAVTDAAQTHYRSAEYKELLADANRFVKPEGTVFLPPLTDFNALAAPPPLPPPDCAPPGVDAEAAELEVMPAVDPPPRPPPEAGEPEARAELASAPGILSVEDAWARAWNLKFSRATPKGGMLLTARYAIRATNHTLGEVWFVTCSKLSYDCRVHRLERAPGDSLLQLVLPLRAFLSQKMFSMVRGHADLPVKFSRVPLTWITKSCNDDTTKLLAAYNLATEEPLFDVFRCITKTVELCAAPAASMDGGDIRPAPPKRARTAKAKASGVRQPRKPTPIETLKKFLRIAESQPADDHTLEVELAGLIDELAGEDGPEDPSVGPSAAAAELAPPAGEAAAPAVLEVSEVLCALVDRWRFDRAAGASALETRASCLREWDSNRVARHLCLCTHQKDGVVAVDFFHWIRAPAKQGFALRVKLDRANRVVYSVPNSLGEPAFDLQTLLRTSCAHMVMPDVGVEMCMAFRLPMTDIGLTLKRKWTLALAAQPGLVCFFCHRSGSEAVRLCPLCELSMHDSCAHSVATCILNGDPFETLPEPINECALPQWWTPLLCGLCKCVQTRM